MIKVTCEPQNCRITVEGHSGSAEKGMDLICAGATMLTMTLADLVEDRCEKRSIEIRDGYARIEGDKNAEKEFDFVRRGLRLLAGDYPENVIVADKYV